MSALLDRLLSHIQEDASGCWLWQGYLNREGYGHINVNGSMRPVHRVAYELLVGPIPDGLTIDHLCKVRHCVNPAHMEPVTAVENVRRGTSFSVQNAQKTHCHLGHPYDEANTYWHRGKRYCRACGRRRTAKYQASLAGAL